jgi:hypothetical protein
MEIPSDPQSRTIRETLLERFGMSLFAVMLTVLPAGIYPCWTLGRAEVINKDQYLVPAEVPGLVVLRIYGVTAVIADYDPASREIGTRRLLEAFGLQGRL